MSTITANGRCPAPSLDTCAENARLSLACLFSSSDEYEAALISERRAAGAYRAPFLRRHLPLLLLAVLAAGALTLFL